MYTFAEGQAVTAIPQPWVAESISFLTTEPTLYSFKEYELTEVNKARTL